MAKGACFYAGQFDDSRPRGGQDAHGGDLREAVRRMLAGEEPLARPYPSSGCNIKWKKGNEPEWWGERGLIGPQTAGGAGSALACPHVRCVLRSFLKPPLPTHPLHWSGADGSLRNVGFAATGITTPCCSNRCRIAAGEMAGGTSGWCWWAAGREVTVGRGLGSPPRKAWRSRWVARRWRCHRF